MPMAIMLRTNDLPSCGEGTTLTAPHCHGRPLLRCRPTTCLCWVCRWLCSAAATFSCGLQPRIAHTAPASRSLLAPRTRTRSPASIEARLQGSTAAAGANQLAAQALLLRVARRCSRRPPSAATPRQPTLNAPVLVLAGAAPAQCSALQPWHRSLRLPTSVGGRWEGCAATCRSAASAAKVRLPRSAKMMAALEAPACLHKQPDNLALSPAGVVERGELLALAEAAAAGAPLQAHQPPAAAASAPPAADDPGSFADTLVRSLIQSTDNPRLIAAVGGHAWRYHT